MHYSTILTLVTIACSAAAAPNSKPRSSCDGLFKGGPKEFAVFQWTYGFSAPVGDYQGIVTVPGFAGPAECHGHSNALRQWVNCDKMAYGRDSGIQTYLDFNAKKGGPHGTWTLKVRWLNPNDKYYYYAEKRVYVETASQEEAKKAEAIYNFVAPVEARAASA